MKFSMGKIPVQSIEGEDEAWADIIVKQMDIWDVERRTKTARMVPTER